MKIAIFIQDSQIENFLAFLLEKSFSVSVNSYRSKADLIRDIKEGSSNPQLKIELMILDEAYHKDSELEQIVKDHPEISKIIFEEGQILALGQATEKNEGVAQSQISASQLILEVKKWVDHRVLNFEVVETGQCRIRTNLLLDVAPLKGDIYVRLSDNKYLKLFRKGDIFDQQDLEKYTLKKGIDYLYILRSECAEFAQKYTQLIESYIAGRQMAKSLSKTAHHNRAVLETIHQLNEQIGFTPEVQELTKAQVKLTVDAMQHSQSLAEVLSLLQEKEDQYIATHSTICAFMACAIASQLQWGSEMTFQKLTLAAFLHDIPLQSQELAAVGSLSELERVKSKFTPEEIRTYEDHPLLAADMARKMSEIPANVDIILAQHHERPDGSGFPRSLASNYIAPLSAVFIVAHDIADFVLSSGDDFKMASFLDQMRPRYSFGQFKKIFVVLENSKGLV